MSHDSAEQVKKQVRQAYGKTATGSGSCCGPSCCGSQQQQAAALAEHAELLGYSTEEIDAAPDGANLGLGCGNPVALAELQEGQTVVDLGSGAGFDCFLAAGKVGPTGKVIGVDMTPEMLAKARENAVKGGYTNVEFREGDIESLPIEDESVDVIISNCVLNLVPDKRKAFAGIFRALRRGGTLAVSDIVLLRDLPETLRRDPAVYSSCIGGAIAKDEYIALLREAGFSTVEVVDEVDAAAMLTCSSGPVSDLVREYGLESLDGWAASVKLKAVKPLADPA